MGSGNVNKAMEELRARYERLSLLYQVSNVIHSTLDPVEAFSLLIKEAVRITRANSGSLVLVNPTTGFLEIQASHGLPPRAEFLKLRVGEGLTGWVARAGKSLLVDDVRTDRRNIMLTESARSELVVPLEVDGEVRGVINVDSTKVGAFTIEDQQLLEDIAVQAARVIRNTWLYEQFRLKAQLFESLSSVSRIINSTINLDEALTAVTREACVLMRGKMCSLLLLDEGRQWLDLRASHGAGQAYLSKPRLNVEESLLGVVVRRKKPVQVENVQLSSRYQNVSVARQEGLVSLLSVPLVYNDSATGVLSVYHGDVHIFSNEEIRILTALAELSAIAIEKARLYERVVDTEEQLRQNEKLSALGLLAAEVAHEIRNPLTVLKMLFHSLNLDFPPGDPRVRDVKVIGEKMEHLNIIVEQILDFARCNEPVLRPVNLNHLLEDLCLLVRHKFAQQKTELVCRLDPDLPRVSGDSTQLEQAFLNLILNALEAMPGGGRLTLTTRWSGAMAGEGERPLVEIEVQDTGCGMTEEMRSRVFQSLLNTSKAKGTGLGLVIVSRIVEAHHGHIEVFSSPGNGTRFVLQLPVAEEIDVH
jgi:signal transduction histidine kinase